MAEYSSNELRSGIKVLLDGDPCVVISGEFVKPGKGQGFTRIKLRNLNSGHIWERTVKSSEKLEKADVLEQDMQFLYTDGTHWCFMDTSSYEQYQVDSRTMGDAAQWVKEQDICRLTLWNGTPLLVAAPNFVELKVTQAEPGVKGDTATGGTKSVGLETGATVQVPLFISSGEVIRVDTRSGEYQNRVKS